MLPSWPVYLGPPYHTSSTTAQGASVEDEAIQHDHYLVLVSVNLDPERERYCLRSLFQRRLDDLILAPTFTNLLQEEVQTLLERTSPVVFLGPHVEGDCVYDDRTSGAGAPMDHLISLGHRRIGFINGVVRPGAAENRSAGRTPSAWCPWG